MTEAGSSLLDRALPARRPSLAFMLSHPAHLVALGFGSGLAPIAPGTWGTAWAWAGFMLLQQWLAPAQLGELIALSLPVGWWACTVTARHLRIADPSCIVWDEIVCFWIILWLLLPAGWAPQLAAFVLFRLFDALKPGPIGWADQLCKKCLLWRSSWSPCS